MPNPSATAPDSTSAANVADEAANPGLAGLPSGTPTGQRTEAVGGSSPTGPIDSPAAAIGRRILSTAFVRVGPDGHLAVELKDGRVIVLRDVKMGSKDYCGTQVAGGGPGGRYCGGYADVAAARPGGGPPPDQNVTPSSEPPAPAIRQ